MAKKKNSKAGQREKKEEDPEVDYAAAADSFAAGGDDGDDNDEPIGEEEHNDNDRSAVEHESSDEDGSVHDDDDDEVDVSSGDDEGSVEEQEGGDDDDLADDSHQSVTGLAAAVPVSANGERCTFDLRNLLAMNTHQVDAASLYSAKRKGKKTINSLTISPPDGLDLPINEKYLLEKATDGCTQLVATLWQLPIERSDAGPMATLPSYEESRIPRALVSELSSCSSLGYNTTLFI